MNFDDPFWGYSLVLRALIYVVLPAFTALQYFRLRRAAHVFQLESYKPHWFRRWVRENRPLFVSGYAEAKKPLVMTGRVWRMVVTATVLSAVGVLIPAGIIHVGLGGWPLDVPAFLVLMGLVFLFTPDLLLLSDRLMSPVQSAINKRFLRSAEAKLREIGPLVIGVTGSYGKTSTKAAIAHVLGDGTLATPGSFNTTLGVSRTINELLQPDHRYFVVEMGARQVGDVREICHFVRHRIGVLTAIGPAHLESFGSLEAIRRGKSEIVTELPPDGIAVLNVDDDEVRRVADESAVETVRYGIEAEHRPDVTVTDLWLSPEGTGMVIADKRSGDELRVQTKLLGRHAVGHVLAATSVALAAGKKLAELEDAIVSLEPVEHRLQIIQGAGGVTVIDDAYNSNPAGAAAALDVLSQMPGGRKVVVTPGMVELGELQQSANEEFGERAARSADVVIFVAPLNRAALVAGAERAGGAEVIVVDSLKQATVHLQGLLRSGDVVLFENDLPDQYET